MKLTFKGTIPGQETKGSLPGIGAPPPDNKEGHCCGVPIDRTTTPWHCSKCHREYIEKDGKLVCLG